jgi:hypothetical protein
MYVRQPARCNDQAAIRKAREAYDRALDLGSIAHVDMTYLNHEQWRHSLDDAELADPGGNAGIPKHRHSRDVWRDLFEQFQPFSADTVFKGHEAGDVAARLRQAVYEAGTDRISDGCEHDWHRAGYLQQRPHGGSARGQDDIGSESSQFGRVPADGVGIGRGPAGVNLNVSADDPVRLR